MSQELHYTSVARGLKPGSRGFGTVAATANLPDSLAERLEGLSAYRAVYPPGDPSAELNPVAYVHVRLMAANHLLDALSRIGPAGLDYSGRPNKYAHHVLLEHEERPEGGPAWLLSQPGFLQDSWRGEPRILPQGRPVPRGDQPASIARSWHDLTGDAGWAGVLAESFLADPRRPVFLIFRPGIELLPLFVEAIALLPASRRWDVEFSTYLTNLPPGIWCTWRGVLEGSAEAKNARRLPNALIVDLCHPPGRAQGGALVHLARTGERLDIPDAGIPAASGARHGPAPHAPIMAGPPRRIGDPGPERSPGAPDWLPDLAARLGEDESLLGGDRLPRPRGRHRFVWPLVTSACVLLLLLLMLSPAVRRGLGLERKPKPPATLTGRPDPPEPIADRSGDPSPLEASSPHGPAVAAEENASGTVAKSPVEKKVVAEAAPTPPAPPKPDVPKLLPPAPPLILAFATPMVPRSSFSPTRQDIKLSLPEDTDERIAIRNGPDFQVTAAAGAPHTWEIATRSKSQFQAGFPLARLNRLDARTWRFDWTEKAKTQATRVENLKDAILELHGRGGRTIYVLLRGLEFRVERPLEVWKNQKILFDRLEPRIRSVEWTPNPDVLEGTRWKPRVRRWRVVLARSESDRGAAAPLERVLDSGPLQDEKDVDASASLARDLIPGEVKLKVAMDPSRPGSIEVRIEPDPEKVQPGRDRRSSRWDALQNDTPKDKDGDAQDPMEYRQSRLRKFRQDGGNEPDKIKSLQGEIAELESIREIRGTEDLLTHPARVALSVVIGLDVDGPGILDIVRIGEFAGDR